MTACTATDHNNERSHTLGARLDGRDYEDEVLLNAIARDPTPLADGRGVAQGRASRKKEWNMEVDGRVLVFICFSRNNSLTTLLP